MSLTSSDVTAKAAVLIEALPYIQRFRGSVFVVKYGGSFVEDPEVRERVVTDLVFLSAVGIRVVVVHGGGKAISRAMEASGQVPVFNRGMRVTDAGTVAVVEQTLNGEINLELCENLQFKGGRPLRIKGQDVLVCRKLETDSDGNPIDLGFVGEVVRVQARRIQRALRDGYMPVVSPLAADRSGQFYNTNADVAAGHVASALRARRLVYLCDVPGLMRKPQDPASLISTLSAEDVPALKQAGVIGSGMIPKVDSAVAALRNGVSRVHFIDGRHPHSLLLEIFTDRGVGTEIVH